MSGSTLLVKPGPPQQLSGAPLGDNTVIYNSDSTNTVWISSVQSVAPGNGIPLKSFSTATWIGKQLWACVDTGVTQSVELIVSNDVSQFTDIAGVAAATADLLLAQGIPSVYLSDYLFNSQIAHGIGDVDVDISKYASLIIFIANYPLASFAAFCVDIIQSMFTGQSGITDEAFMSSIKADANNNTLTIVMPVSGDFLSIFNDSVAGTVDITVVGTNRLVPQTKLMRAIATPRSVTLNQTVVSGTIYPLTDNNGVVILNGAVYAAGFATVAGSFYLHYINQQGADDYLLLFVAPTGAANGSVQIGGITGNVEVVFQPSASGACLAGLHITALNPS